MEKGTKEGEVLADPKVSGLDGFAESGSQSLWKKNTNGEAHL